MSKKSDHNIRFILLNLVSAVVMVLVAVVGLLLWLKVYTQHGVEVEVPSVTGLYQVEAEQLLASQHLKMEVIDSTFSAKVPLGTIVEQNPSAGNHAKHDRTVYVIVNTSFKPRVPLPDLHDISYRQAITTLKSMKLNVEEVIYEPSEYKDIVLDVLMGDSVLEVGQRVEEGSSVVLVIGRGKGTEKVETPELRGKNLREARATLLGRYLTVGLVEYDEPVTPENADSFMVYQQIPVAGEKVLEGSRVDLQLTKDLDKTLHSGLEDSEEDFF